MLRNFRLSTIIIPLTALLAVLAFTCLDAQAQVKPFKVKGVGHAPEGLSVVGENSPYSATGTATHLGKYSGEGFARVTGIDAEPTRPNAVITGEFTGAFDFVAANGDVLACVHPGTFAVYSDGQDRLYAIFDAIFTPTSDSTGKFKNVGGSFRMIATTESFDILPTGSTTPFDFEWHGEERFLEFSK